MTKEMENKILELHKQGYNSREIAKMVEVSDDCIYKFMKKRGLKSNNKKSKISDEQKQFIIDLYVNKKMTIQAIHKQYFKDICSEGLINKILRKEGVTRKAVKVAHINHDYFENIDTEHKAYWVGFILADGNVRQQKEKGECYVLNVSVKEDDGYLLEDLVLELESDRKVKYYHRKVDSKSFDDKYIGKDHNTALVSFNSKKIFDDLAKYGIVPRKSLIINCLPILENESLMPHLIRGYFDGNGTVYVNSQSNTLKVAFYGTHALLEDINNYLSSKLNVNKKSITDQKSEQVSLYSYASKNDIQEFYDYIYKDATIFLKRKKDLFDSKL